MGTGEDLRDRKCVKVFAPGFALWFCISHPPSAHAHVRGWQERRSSFALCWLYVARRSQKLGAMHTSHFHSIVRVALFTLATIKTPCWDAKVIKICQRWGIGQDELADIFAPF